MKVRYLPMFVMVTALVAAGCGESDCGVDAMCLVDTVGGDTLVPDEGNQDDTAVADTTADTVLPDVREDVTADTVDPSDITSPDTVEPDTTADECVTKYDCEGCETCVDEGGVMKCVDMTIYAGVAQCYQDDNCEEGQVCHFGIVGRPACGGYCDDGAAYSLHEWGVNVVTVEGAANMSASPKKFYGAVVAKPVVYIYSDEQFTLDVGVHYKTGAATETWPEIPLSDDVVWEGIQVGTDECITSATPLPDMSGMAEVESREIYDLPAWVVPDANCLTYGETISKVLFYTGPLAGYVPGVEAQMNLLPDQDKAVLTVTNSLADAVAGPVIALYRWTESHCVDPSYCPVHHAKLAWAVIENVPVGGPTDFDMEFTELEVEVPEDEPNTSVIPLLPAGWKSLPDTLKQGLITKGLTEAEATVFMTAWTESMFGLLGEDAAWYYPSYSNGGFLIYLWPDSRTNELLPLNAVPAPTTTARALVEYQKVPVTIPETI